MKKVPTLVVFLGGLLAVYIYGFFYDIYLGTQSPVRVSERRARLAEQDVGGDIHVAVVWAADEDQSFADGVNLAIRMINANGIRLKGPQGQPLLKKIVAHRYSDDNSAEAEKAVQAIVGDTRIVASVGHSHSSTALPASSSYEHNGVLFLSAMSTMASLTNHRFKYVYSLSPTDEQYVARLAAFAQQRSFKRLAVLYQRDAFGLNFFQKLAANIGAPLEIIYKRSFSSEDTDQMEAIYNVTISNADALVLGAYDIGAAKMISKLRQMGFDKPIIGTKGLDTASMPGWLGGNGRGIYVISGVRANSMRQVEGEAHGDTSFIGLVSNFESEFLKDYGAKPGYSAFQGFISVNLLKMAFERAGTTVPISVAASLKYTSQEGLLGMHFDESGRRKEVSLYVKELAGSEFIDIE